MITTINQNLDNVLSENNISPKTMDKNQNKIKYQMFNN